MTYNITLTVNHQSLTAKYLPLAAESVQYLTAKVVCETEDWTGREIKAMFEQGCTVYEVPVTGGEITANQQLNLTAGDWRVWLVGNSARDGDVIPRITTNVAHIIVAPTGGTEGNPFPATPPTVEEQLRADMGDLADLTTEDKSSLVAAINEVRQTGGGGSSVQPDWNQNDSTQPDYVKNRPFYTGDPVETVFVEESTVTFAENYGLYMAQFPSTFKATVGETYKVSWDGTTYECACVDFNGYPAIGNLSVAGLGSDTGEPFLMSINNDVGIEIYTADTSASHTISISGIVAPITKIDEKYIPELPYMDKVNPTGTGSFSLNRKANTTIGNYSFTEGYDTTASGDSSHAEGKGTTASGDYSHAEGYSTTASGDYSHAEGYSTTASGDSSYAEGESTTASGYSSHAEGYYTTASGDYSHAEGCGTKASSKDQHVHGKYNIEDTSDTYAEIIGNGTSYSERSNAATVDWSGNAWYAGTVEGTALILPSSTAASTKKFKITVDDSGVPTITDESDSTNTWKPTNLPTVTSSDSGKFLRVSDTGEWVAEMQDGSATDTVVTASASAWSNNTITLSVTGVMADSKLEIGLSETATDEQYAAATAAQIRATGSGDGTVTLKAAIAPTIDLPIIIRRLS